MKPTVGRIVHYKSYGTPGGEYKSEPRAAVVTAVHGNQWDGQEAAEFGEPGYLVDLCVLNPTGMFFNQKVLQGDKPGQWNWPPRE